MANRSSSACPTKACNVGDISCIIVADPLRPSSHSDHGLVRYLGRHTSVSRDVTWMVCQYFRPGLVSSEKHTMAPLKLSLCGLAFGCRIIAPDLLPQASCLCCAVRGLCRKAAYSA